MKKVILLFSLAIFISGNENSDKKYVQNNPEIIELSDGFKKTKGLNLSDIASNVEYIKLETNNQNLFGNVSKIDIYNNDLIIMDRKIHSVFKFNLNGHFISKIGKRGKGPGEYAWLDNFIINHNNGEIYLTDIEIQKILHFSKNGKFIKRLKNDLYGKFIRLFSNNTFCYYKPYIFKIDKSVKKYDKLLITDIDGNETKRLFTVKFPTIEELSSPANVMVKIYNYYDSISVWQFGMDTIYRISENYNITPKYIFDYGPNRIPKSLFSNGKRFMEEIDNYASIMGFSETDNSFFINGLQKGELKRIYYNKNTKECFNVFDNAKLRSSGEFSSINNDFDGGISFWPHGQTSNGKLYRSIDIQEIKDFLKKNESMNIKIKYPEKLKSLKEIVDKSDIDDNPIIMLVTLKK